MLMTTTAYAAWFSGKNVLAISAIAFSAILGWPFAGALGVPIAIDLIRKQGFKQFFASASGIGGVIACTVIGIDTICYGKLVFPPLNIVLYNIISGHGPELYGTEPWYFYMTNGFLNFNIAFPLALATPVFVLSAFLIDAKKRNRVWNSQSWSFVIGFIAGVVIWLGIFIRTPHKEERFLFPIYGLIALLAAVSVELTTEIPKLFIQKRISSKTVNKAVNFSLVGILCLFSGLSMMRSVALNRFYSAPIEIYRDFQLEAGNLTTSKQINVCVGKEWHRFPSSFFLPNHWELQFIKSEFRGLLPKPFRRFPQGMRVIPTEMNDANREEISRYVDICQCQYLVDLEFEGQTTALEPHYSKNKKEWKSINNYSFLDAANSNRFLRAFYVPLVSDQFCKFGNYLLLKRIKQCARK